MTYRQLYKSFKTQLSGIYDSGEIESMFFIALESVLGLKKIDYFMNENQLVENIQNEQFNAIMEDLKGAKPLQYVLGEAWFNENRYFVNDHVLIPRSETEELIRLVGIIRPNAQSIIDLGTGSGCIAIELALALKIAVFALDISEGALNVAIENAKRLNASVNFKRANMLDETLDFSNKFDIIVSNPPYVMDSEKELMKENVLNFEPEGALFVTNEDPLVFYRAIRSFAVKHSNHKALIAMEINEQLGKETAALFSQPFVDVLIHKDIQGKDRFVTAIYEGE